MERPLRFPGFAYVKEHIANREQNVYSFFSSARTSPATQAEAKAEWTSRARVRAEPRNCDSQLPCEITETFPCRMPRCASSKEMRWIEKRPLKRRSPRSSAASARAPSCGSARTRRRSRSRPSRRARSASTSRSASAACRAAASSRFMGPNPRARPRSRSMSSPRRRSGAAFAASSTRSTRSTPSMRASSASISNSS